MSYTRVEDEREDKADSFFVDNRQKAVRSENAEETGQTRPNSLVGKILGAQPKDQHAAHEKVKYEQILSKVENSEIYTQVLTPPVVISVTPKEAALLNSYGQYFKELGFEIEDFGMNAFAIRGVPLDLFGHDIKNLFEEILTQMVESPVRGVPQIIREKIASMACKAAVKGNNSLTYEEADQLIEQLLELDNPYNCPHGRPTIISMSKYEIEKKFKRII